MDFETDRSQGVGFSSNNKDDIIVNIIPPRITDRSWNWEDPGLTKCFGCMLFLFCLISTLALRKLIDLSLQGNQIPSLCFNLLVTPETMSVQYAKSSTVVNKACDKEWPKTVKTPDCGVLPRILVHFRVL